MTEMLRVWLIIAVAALVTGITGCSTTTVAKKVEPQRWGCIKVDGRGPTGANVECRRVITDSQGDAIYDDGPPVPVETLDPVPRPPRTGWSKFWHDYGAVIWAASFAGITVWATDHNWNKNNN